MPTEQQVDTHIFISTGDAHPLPGIRYELGQASCSGAKVVHVCSVGALLAGIRQIKPGTCNRLDIIGHSGMGYLQIGHVDGIGDADHYLDVADGAVLGKSLARALQKGPEKAEVRFIGCFTAVKLSALISGLQADETCSGMRILATNTEITHGHYRPLGTERGANANNAANGPFGVGLFAEFPCK